MKGFQVRCVIYDENLFNLLKRLGRKQGIFVEASLREFLKTEKGQKLFELFLGETDDWELDFGNEEEQEKKQSKRKKKFSVDDFL